MNFTKSYNDYTRSDLLLLDTMSYCNDKKSLLLKSIATDNDILTSVLIKNNVRLEVRDNNGDTPLILLIKRGSLDIALELCQRITNLDDVGECGHTALTIASKLGHEKVVSYLLGCNIDINHKTDTGANALVYATVSNKYNCVKLLLESGINVNDSDNDGLTALMYASRFSHKRIMRRLLREVDINVDMVDKDGFTALLYASKNGHRWQVNILLERGANRDYKGGPMFGKHSALSLAHKCGHDKVVELLKNGARQSVPVGGNGGVITTFFRRLSSDKLE